MLGHVITIIEGNHAVFNNFLHKHKTFIIYVFWGGIATIVNIGTFMLWLKLGRHYQAGNILAWLLAVFVTYFSNKFLVFSSQYHGIGQLLRELGSFLVVRLFALALDIVIIWLGIKVLNYSSFLVKIFDNTVVGILNYIVSKWYIFTDKNI